MMLFPSKIGRLGLLLIAGMAATCAKVPDEVTNSTPDASIVEQQLSENKGLPAAVRELFAMPEQLSLVVGVEGSVEVFALLENGETRAVSDLMQWSSSAPAVVAIAADGAKPFSPLTAGEATLTGELLGKEVTLDAIVVDAAVRSLTLDVTATNPRVGESVEVKALAVLSDFTVVDVSGAVSCDKHPNLKIVQQAARLSVSATKATNVSLNCSYQARSASVALNVKAAGVQRLTIEPAVITVVPGVDAPFKVVAYYTDGHQADVTAQAAVEVSGVSGIAVTAGELVPDVDMPAHTKGSLAASHLGLFADAQIVTTDARLTALGFDPATLSVPVGVRADVRVNGTYSDGSEFDLTDRVAITSGDENVAGVGGPALAPFVEGRAVGTVTVTASVGDLSASLPVTVTAARLTTITVTGSTLSLAAGQNTQLTATGTYSNGQNADITTQVIWQSSRPATAVVSDSVGTKGRLSAVNTTTTTYDAEITASVSLGDDIVSGSVDVVILPPSVTSIAMTPPSASRPLGKTQTFAATATYSNGTTASVTPQATWYSDYSGSGHANVLLVSNNGSDKGKAKAVGIGTAVVVAALGGVTGTAVMSATTKVPEQITVSQGTSLQMDVGAVVDLTAQLIYSDLTAIDATNHANTTWSLPPLTTLVTLHDAAVTGRLTAVSEGYVTVTVAFDDGTTSVQAPIAVQVRSRCDAGGVRNGNYCYRFSAKGDSCNAACSAAGGVYHDATRTEVGTVNLTCRDVLAALDSSYAGMNLQVDGGTNPDNQGLGCSSFVMDVPPIKQSARYALPITDGPSSHPDFRRVCACTR